MLRRIIGCLVTVFMFMISVQPLAVNAEGTAIATEGMFNEDSQNKGGNNLSNEEMIVLDDNDQSLTTVCQEKSLWRWGKDTSGSDAAGRAKESTSAAIPKNGAESNSVSKPNARSTYISVFASPKGKGYSLNQAKSAAKSTYMNGDYVYVWGYLHDGNGNLYKNYGSGKVNLTVSIYRPNGSCKYTYTYSNCDNNWIGVKLDTSGTWRIESRVSGSLVGSTSTTIKVNNKTTYLGHFVSTKGKGYSLNQAKSSSAGTYTKGEFVYLWGYLHDGNGNFYKSYGSGTVNLTLSFYRPNGSRAYTYTYNNCDNNWIGVRLDSTGTWKVEVAVSGSLSGKTTGSITVNKPRINSAILAVDYKSNTTEATKNSQAAMYYLMCNNKISDYEVSTSNQHTLFKSSTTPDYIDRFLDNAFSNSKDGDINTFYFCGHGAADHIGLGGGKAYYYNALAKKLNSYKGKMVVILDTCCSEGFINNGINRLSDRSRMYAICSSAVNEYSTTNYPITYKKLKYSAFTYTLGSAMGFFYAKDGVTGNQSVTNLYNYVNKNIGKKCKTMHPKLYRPDNYALYIYKWK